MPAVNLDLGLSSFEASTAVSVPNINRKVLCRAHSNAFTLSPCMQVLDLWLNCLFSTWMRWKLVLLQPKAKSLLFYSRYIEVVKRALCVLQIASCALLNSTRENVSYFVEVLWKQLPVHRALCPWQVRWCSHRAVDGTKSVTLTLAPVKLSSNSAPGPRRWRILVDLPLAAAKLLGQYQE